MLSLESCAVMGHVCGEHRTQISKKADFISSVAQGTTCLLMQLLYVHSPPSHAAAGLRVSVVCSAL